jgi:hypothetical protein
LLHKTLTFDAVALQRVVDLQGRGAGSKAP